MNMERMRTKFIIAVTQRLAAAEDTAAKIELIEELSENLFSRWKDLAAGGAEENEAYARALDDLGDVDELLAYLDSLGPEGELPKSPDSTVRDFTSDILHGVEDIVKETVSQTKDAMDQAAVIVRNLADKIKEKYPDGFKGKIVVHMDRDEEQNPEEEPDRAAPGPEEKGWSFTVGYNRDRGGFFCGNPAASRRVTDTVFSAEELGSADIQLVNGDVKIMLDDDPNADVHISGQTDKLDVRISDGGVLSIRQGNTASSSFFFLRGLASADVELTLPKRCWETLKISTVNGDIDIADGLEARELLLETGSGDIGLRKASCTDVKLKSGSGDISFRRASCTKVKLQSGSGDMDCGGTVEELEAQTASGDLSVAGEFGKINAVTSSGDIKAEGSVREMRGASVSGDVSVKSQVLPETLELSSKSGDCEAAFPDGEGFTLQFSAVTGDLESAFPLAGPVGARSGEAIYLDGGGRLFRMSTVSGDLSLRCVDSMQ